MRFLCVILCLCVAFQGHGFHEKIAQMEDQPVQKWDKDIFEQISHPLALRNLPLSKLIQSYTTYTIKQKRTHRHSILAHLRLGANEIETATDTKPEDKTTKAPQHGFPRQHPEAPLTTDKKDLSTEEKKAIEIQPFLPLIPHERTITHAELESAQQENNTYVVLKKTHAKEKAKSELDIKKALTSVQFSHVATSEGKIISVSQKAGLIVSLFKRFRNDFHPAYVMAFDDLLHQARHYQYRMHRNIHDSCPVILSFKPQENEYMLRILIQKELAASRSVGSLSPFSYQDITLWPGQCEITYVIKPGRRSGFLTTTPTYKWVRPMHTYPQEYGFVAKDKHVYELKKFQLKWKYLWNRMQQGDMSTQLKDALVAAQMQVVQLRTSKKGQFS